MSKLILSISAGFLSLFLFPTAFAWNALGHMVIANIAYHQLKPDTKVKLDQLVLNLQQEYPNVKSFVEMSYWADSLRGQKIDTYSRWHYIDIAFSNDGTPLKNLIDTDNAVWALNNIKVIVKNNKANVYERARFLAFLIHITGDLHQPLHSVTYISANHPDGDRGGNDFYIFNANQRMNLHRLWDGGVGYFETEQTSEKANLLTKTIMTLYPSIYFGKKVTDLNFDNWAQEGVNNAKKYVYSSPENARLDNRYIQTGQQISQEQVALAGYRLGMLLEQLLG